MSTHKKVHLLSQELIPVMDDLEDEPKQIILEHITECDECRKLYEQTVNFDENMPKHDYSDEVELKPLKKLVQFNTGLKLLLIAVRVVILFYIFYSSFRYFDVESITLMLEYFQSGIILFYTPAAVFLLVFTITFFNKKWVWISLLADLIIIFFLANVVELFI